MKNMLTKSTEMTNKLYSKHINNIQLNIKNIITSKRYSNNKLIELLVIIEEVYKAYTSIGYTTIQVTISSKYLDIIKNNPMKDLTIDVHPMDEQHFVTAYYKTKIDRTHILIYLSKYQEKSEIKVTPIMFGDIEQFNIK